MKKSSGWNVKKSDQTYNISGWGAPYFSINKQGEVAVHPKGNARSTSLKTLIKQITDRGIQTPFLLRFNDILLHRMSQINQVFLNAKQEYSYKGNYSIIYPIKVNQQMHVVQQISDYCAKNGHGLEGGSKPELLAVMALSPNSDTPIVCNGYKDKEFFEIAFMGTKLGKKVYPVIEKYSEFETMIEVAKSMNIKPNYGVRIKLTTVGSGKWQSSSGHRSKFGLTINELLRGVEMLRDNDMLDGLKLLHFHQGSQITNISTLKKSLKEACRAYVELTKLGAPLEIMDVGGGLGVDYSGCGSSQDSSMNYSLQEYANDVVFQIKEICEEAGLKHPDIFTECGRAVVAHHAILIFDVLGISGYDKRPLPQDLPKDAPKPLRQLFEIRKALKKENSNINEHYHDIVSLFQECQNLFSLGYMTIQSRGLAEDVYFSCLKRIQALTKKYPDELVEDLKNLDEMLSDTYFGNFSVFQSLPDHWAIDHQFPIAPIHRLKEEPSVPAVIADITCDSDGKIDLFIDDNTGKRILNLHPNIKDEPYYLGVFLVGAYQETLGDLHNLFGDTNAVHVTFDNRGNPLIQTIVRGDTVKEVLTYVQYDVGDLLDMMHAQVEKAVRANLIDYKESGQFINFYQSALEGYTYLEDWEAREEY